MVRQRLDLGGDAYGIVKHGGNFSSSETPLSYAFITMLL